VMRVTFLGHVGMFVETDAGSVLCDPWFTPAYFGSWFPFPRNDTLDVSGFEAPTFLYISHLHRDHFDPEWLAAHVDRSTTVLLPDFRVPYLERELRTLGFERFVTCPSGARLDLDGLEVVILAQNAPADGPLGDSAIVLGDGETRLLNQNDARPGSAAELRALGPFDAQFVQFSGAIWYPVAYDFPPEEKAQLARDKRANQMHRACQYIEWVDAAHVFPCAGPPAFLDDELFALNDFDRDDTNIFPDQRVFLDALADRGVATGHLIVPGTVIELHGRECALLHPNDESISAPFESKRAYLERYAADKRPWLATERSSWSSSSSSVDPERDLVAELAAWFEPLLVRAPITSSGVGGIVVLRTADVAIAIDFVNGDVREWHGEPPVYRVDVDRRLIEACIDRHYEDWVNSLFLSARFTAHREGGFNEYVMTFFKALSVERIDHVERCYSELREGRNEWFELDGWRIERFCPHRQADLAEFGDIDGGILTCALHHWQFELESGRCLTSDDRRLRCERLD
jgi:UDP-MurNAc hydroxylase